MRECATIQTYNALFKRYKLYFKSCTNGLIKSESLSFHTVLNSKKKGKETCTLVILIYRTCENRVDENPAFLHYNLLYFCELKKMRINRRKSRATICHQLYSNFLGIRWGCSDRVSVCGESREDS